MAQAEITTSKAIIRGNPVRSLAKAVLLLDTLADEREATPRRLSELLHEPRTTVYRLLTGLQALDMVEAGSRAGTYRLGWRLLRLGSAVIERLDERQAALPVMERIHERTGETIFLCCPACEKDVLADPEKALKKVAELRGKEQKP